MGFQHHMTPKKAGIQRTCDFLDANRGRIPFNISKNDVFKFNKVHKITGYRILRQPRVEDGRTFHSSYPETRGRKRLLGKEELAKIEHFIDTNGFDGRTVGWAGLPAAAGLDVDCHPRTVRRAVKDIDLRMCIACRRKYISPEAKSRREEFARVMLEKYPNKEDWYHIRFSDECHFGWGPQGCVHIIRRPWERYCGDCLLEQDEPEEKDTKRLHCWAAIGHDFKSDLTWYNVPTNNNGKMSMKVYRDEILEQIVKPWLDEGTHFVLEEDNDSGHGTSKHNIVKTWKQLNGLESYWNCNQSPDFSPIERCWLAPKQYVAKRPCWEDSIVKELAEEGWAALSQKRINHWVDQMPQIFKDCIELEGALTGH